LRARPALGVSVGEQQSHYCDTEQNKTDRAHGSSPSPSFRAANAKGEGRYSRSGSLTARLLVTQEKARGTQAKSPKSALDRLISGRPKMTRR
jgi:hypothetical protein